VAGDETLVRMARMLGEATAASTTIWLADDAELRPTVSWPTDVPRPSPVRVEDADELPIEATLALPVRHQGGLLGAISMVKRPGERLRPAEEQLARDLASQAGLVLHNVRLVAALRAHFAELQTSRRRLVAAQDRARKRLERNIHDGAQQQLVALSVRTNLAKQVVTKSPEKAKEILRSLRAEVDRTLEDLAELARGIVPAALTELGLVEALRAQAARAALPVAVEAPNDLPSAPDNLEATVYFCTLEALQNVAKYAEATHATVCLRATGGELTFEVTDDGRGFDTATTSYGTGMHGMEERLAAVSGRLDVRSSIGVGTVVTGRVPLAENEAADQPERGRSARSDHPEAIGAIR
jgi:signal transduction histidine kinase